MLVCEDPSREAGVENLPKWGLIQYCLQILLCMEGLQTCGENSSNHLGSFFFLTWSWTSWSLGFYRKIFRIPTNASWRKSEFCHIIFQVVFFC